MEAVSLLDLIQAYDGAFITPKLDKEPRIH